MGNSNSVSNARVLNLRKVAAAACLALAALACARAQAVAPTPPDFNKVWTTVGSAGTVDETDVNKVFFDRSVVQMGRVIAGPAITRGRGALVGQTQSAVIRYNVTAVDGLFVGPKTDPIPGVQMRVRFLDTGNSARVLVRLVEVDAASGNETTRLTFDSNGPNGTTTPTPSNRYQIGFVGECGPLWGFDFRKNAYYIEATLTGSAISVGGASGIQVIKIDNAPCRF